WKTLSGSGKQPMKVRNSSTNIVDDFFGESQNGRTRKAGKEDRAAKYEHLFDAEAKKISLKERMVHVQEEVLAQQRQLMQFQIQEAQAAREDHKERIMTMELANLSAEARAYWKRRQAEILKRRNWTA
ncbi:hypothetical protein BAE44_0021071, partial [Dichanthelium oligosanthes]